MDLTQTIMASLAKLLDSKKPVCILEFFDDPHGEGEEEAVGVSEGSVPAVGEFVWRIKKNEFTQHRVSKRIHVFRDNTLIPYLICPSISPQYYRELSDAYMDYLLVLINKDGQESASRQIKNSNVPTVGSQVIDGDKSYGVREHFFVALDHIVTTGVIAHELSDSRTDDKALVEASQKILSDSKATQPQPQNSNTIGEEQDGGTGAEKSENHTKNG
jgi:hypothetical protein